MESASNKTCILGRSDRKTVYSITPVNEHHKYYSRRASTKDTNSNLMLALDTLHGSTDNEINQAR